MHVEIHFPEDYPLEELIRYGSELVVDGIVAPGFIPPGRGALDPAALHYMQTIENRPATMLLDLNIVTEIANIASGNLDIITSDFRRSVGKLMAVCQLNDVALDPSLAIHEKAQTMGHERAREMLEWFRAGDNASPWEWLEIARGTPAPLSTKRVSATLPGMLDTPIRRFGRNYLLSLKIADLALDPTKTSIGRLTEFVEWFREHMYWAGSAALFAATYLSPEGPKAGLMERLKSPNRSKALDGARKQAWDLTHLSEFGKAVAKAGDRRRLLFATKDQGLATMAQLVCVYPSASEIEDVFSPWWGPVDAATVGKMYSSAIETAEATRDQHQPISGKPESWVDAETRRLEEKIEAWRP